MFDPIIQRHMTHFFDVQGNLHITLKPDLIKSLGWAKTSEKNGEPVLDDSIPICLDINYVGEIGDFNKDCDVVIKTKSKALEENVTTE